MFRTSCVHHQENHLNMQFWLVGFSYIYVSRVAGGRMCSILIVGLLVHVTFTLHNWIKLHGTKNIKLLISFVTLCAGCTDYVVCFSTQWSNFRNVFFAGCRTIQNVSVRNGQTSERCSLQVVQTMQNVSVRNGQTSERCSLQVVQTMQNVSVRNGQTSERCSLQVVQTMQNVSLRNGRTSGTCFTDYSKKKCLINCSPFRHRYQLICYWREPAQF